MDQELHKKNKIENIHNCTQLYEIWVSSISIEYDKFWNQANLMAQFRKLGQQSFPLSMLIEVLESGSKH